MDLQVERVKAWGAEELVLWDEVESVVAKP